MDLIILISISFVNVLLGLSVSFRNFRSATNRLLFGFIFATIAWSLTNYIATIYLTALDTSISIIWVRLTMFFAVPQALAFFLLIHTFPKSKLTLRKKILTPLLILGGITMIVTISPYLFTSVTIEDSVATPNPGPGILLFMVIAVGSVIAGLITLIRKYIKASGLAKVQLKYILVGLLMMFILILTFNFGFVVFLNNISFVTLAPVFTLPFIISIAYAIIKHRLLDIHLIILRTITYSLVVLLISATVVGLTLSLPQAFNISTSTRTIIAVIVSIFIVLILEPLKKAIGKATDKLFFKAQVNYPKVHSEISSIINREIDLDILLYSLAIKLEKELKIKNTSIYLSGATGGAFYKRRGRLDPKTGKKINEITLHELEDRDKHDFKHRISHSSSLVKYMRASQEIIVLGGLERKIEDTQDKENRKELEKSKAELDKLDATVVAPITTGGSIKAVMVLGPKLSGDPYGSEDINLLKLIGPQLASALEKSRLYDEARQFTERLKKEVAISTEDLRNTNLQLQERNKFLSALQSVTNIITRTLDFHKVTQSIADSIASELGYIGGIVLFLGKDKRKLFADAVTRSRLTQQVIDLLPKPLTEYWGDYKVDESRTFKTVKEGKVQIGTELTDFISPAVPEDIVEKIQKLLKVRTIISVPIYSEEGIVGAIVYLLKHDPGQIKPTDISIMKALANQSGIVSRNIELYHQLERSNKELGEANKHLQQLDQAKSEFVSITSHQLRTPMTGIMGYLSMILQGDFGKVPKEQKHILGGLLDESQRMIRIINLFLNVSKIESGKMELNLAPVQMEEVIEKVITMVQQPADEKKLKLIFKKPKKKLPLVFADKDKLGDIILNFTDNAIKYTEEGSVTLIVEPKGEYMHFAVKDTGRGIEPDEAKKLFTKFVRGFGIAQVNPDGSGLGLYVARRLAEAHHGKIWVDSEGIGKGSTFNVLIPLHSEEESKAVKEKKEST